MIKTAYEKLEKEIISLNEKFKEEYNKKNFSEAFEIANTLDQRLYNEGLDLLEMCKDKQ